MGLEAGAVMAIVSLVVTTGTQVYAHQQQVKASREQRKATIEAQKNQITAVSVTADPLAPHRIVLGETFLGGNIFFKNTSAEHGRFYNQLQTLAAHEIEAAAIYHNKQRAWADDGKGNSHDFMWLGIMRGDQTTHNQDVLNLVNYCYTGKDALWDANHIGKGIAYMFNSLEWDYNTWNATGIPEIQAIVKGAKPYDWRTGTRAYTTNGSLCLGYALFDVFGAPTSSFLTQSFADYADICDAATIESNDVVWTVAPSAQPNRVTKYWADGSRTEVETGAPANEAGKIYFSESDAWICSNTVVGMGITGSGIQPGTLVTGYTQTLAQSSEVFELNYGEGGSEKYTVVTFIGENSLTLSKNPTNAAADVHLFYTTTNKYEINGFFDLDEAPCDVVGDILDCLRARIVPTLDHKFKLVGGWTDPVATIDESYIINTSDDASITFNAEQSDTAESYNRVIANYPNRYNWWTAMQTDPITSLEWQKIDGGEEKTLEKNFKYTTTGIQAYLQSKYLLFKSRYNRNITLKCNYKALGIEVGDNLIIDLDCLEMGDAEVNYYTVIERAPNYSNNTVTLILRETHPDIYNISATINDIKHAQPTPNVVVTVPPVTSLSASFNDNGTINVDWTNSSSSYCTQIDVKATADASSSLDTYCIYDGSTSFDLTAPANLSRFTIVARNANTQGQYSSRFIYVIQLETTAPTEAAGAIIERYVNDHWDSNVWTVAWTQPTDIGTYAGTAVEIKQGTSSLYYGVSPSGSTNVEFTQRTRNGGEYAAYVANVGVNGIYSEWLTASLLIAMPENRHYVETGSFSGSLNQLSSSLQAQSNSIASIQTDLSGIGNIVAKVLTETVDAAGLVAEEALYRSGSYAELSSSLFIQSSSLAAEVTQRTQQIAGLTTASASFVSAIGSLQSTKVDLSRMQSELTSSTAYITNVSSSAATAIAGVVTTVNTKANASDLASETTNRTTQYNALTGSISSSQAAFDQFAKTVASDTGSLADFATKLLTQTDNMGGAVQTMAGVVLDKTTGKAKAVWTTTVNANGTSGSIELSAESGINSGSTQFIVNADKFAVQAGSTTVQPFKVTANVVTMGVDVMSDNFDTGSNPNGYLLERNTGKAYFTDVIITNPTIKNTLGNPTIIPAQGIFNNACWVTFGNVSQGEAIGTKLYYTTDGSEPNFSSSYVNLATGLTITGSCVLKVKGYTQRYVQVGWEFIQRKYWSDTVTGMFIQNTAIDNILTAPALNVVANNPPMYTIGITAAQAGSTIMYNTDGGSYSEYTGYIYSQAGHTFMAYATKTGCKTSPTAELSI